MSNPVSATAYFCAGVRMMDARRPDSLLHDQYAEWFMGEDGKAIFETFRHLSASIAINQVRCHLIDEIVRAKLRVNPRLRIILVGAGFDSRAFRIRGGCWVELDEASIIERKERTVPTSSCPNPLERVSIAFAEECLTEKLAAWRTDEPVLAICEGVMMYLEPPQIEALATALKANFRSHWLCGDIMTRHFAALYGRRVTRAIEAIGASFRGLENRPLARLMGLGYYPEYRASIIGEAVVRKRLQKPGLKYGMWAMLVLRNGYQVALLRSLWDDGRRSA